MQYKGQPLIEYRGTSTLAAGSTAPLGYLVLFVVGVFANHVQGCTGKFALSFTYMHLP